jgi:hypothetical protein
MLLTKRISFFLCTVCISTAAFGQVSFGVKGGLNFNDISLKDRPAELRDDANMALGFHLGVYSRISISEKFAFIPELQFVQRGAKSGGTRINLNYIELPLLISYAPIKILAIEAGPDFSYKISARARANGNSANLNDIYKNDFDLGLVSGVRVPLGKLSIIARYYVGLVSLSDVHYATQNGQQTTTKEYARSVQIGVAYRLK